MAITKPALAFGVLEVTDGFLTLWATNHQFIEINPLTATMASSWLFPLFKVGLAVLAIAILMPVAKRFPKPVNIGFTAVSVFLMVIVASNIFEIIK